MLQKLQTAAEWFGNHEITLTPFEIYLALSLIGGLLYIIHAWRHAIPYAVREYEDGTVIEYTLRGKVVKHDERI